MHSVSQGSGTQVNQGSDLAEDDGHLGAATLRDPLTHLPDAWAAQTPRRTEHPRGLPCGLLPHHMEGSDGETSSLGSQHTNQQRSSKSGRSCLVSYASPRKSSVALHTLWSNRSQVTQIQGQGHVARRNAKEFGGQVQGRIRKRLRRVCPVSCRIQWENLSDVTTSVERSQR